VYVEDGLLFLMYLVLIVFIQYACITHHFILQD
jgi:hypothetical protein